MRSKLISDGLRNFHFCVVLHHVDAQSHNLFLTQKVFPNTSLHQFLEIDFAFRLVCVLLRDLDDLIFVIFIQVGYVLQRRFQLYTRNTAVVPTGHVLKGLLYLLIPQLIVTRCDCWLRR